MTIKEMDAKYPRVWVVAWCTILSYHDTEKLFLTEAEARAFYNSLKGFHDRRIYQTHDIWGWSKRNKEEA